MNRQGWFLLGLILILGTSSPAQVQELGAPIITNYDPDQYDASSQNWGAIQDHRGVMFFANTGGILEFDGRSWQLIPTPANTTVRALVCGPDGTIYYGSVGDFGYLAATPSGQVLVVSLKEAIPAPDRVLFNDIWQALSSRYGIYFLSRSRIFRLEKGKVHSIQGRFAPSQACLLNGIVFYADMDKGLCMLEGDRVVPIPQLAGVYNGKRIALAPCGPQRLLVGRVTGDFLQLDLGSLWDENGRRFDVSLPAAGEIVTPFPCELGVFLKENNGFLYKLTPVGADAFAVSSLRGGIVTFDRAGKVIRVIDKKRGLLDNIVGDIFMDRAGDMWACSNSGISHVELSVPQSYFGAGNGIDGRSLCARSYGGRLYVGTIRNLLIQAPYHFGAQAGQQLFMPVKNTPNQAWQLLDTGEELLSAGGGLFRIRGENAIKVQGADPTSYCLGTSKRWPEHLFIGLVGGMEVFKRTAGQWRPAGRIKAITDTIRGIAQDSNGDLWAATESRGLLRLHFSAALPTQAEIRHFGPKQGLPGLSHLLAVARGDTLFVLTPKGLFRATIAAGAAQAPERIHFAPDTNLGRSFIDPPMDLNSLVFDKEGNAFFSTSDGVFWAIPGRDGRYRMEARPFRGAPAQQDGALYLHPDGSLWLPGKVLFRFDPKVHKDYGQPFSVLVSNVIAKSRRLVFAGSHGHPGSAFGRQRTVFESSQGLADVPVLPYSENALSFEFAAAFYEKPGTTRFRYLLEGFDREWSEWQDDTKKEYTNLPEGKYRFRVRGKNVYGTEGREAVFAFRILSPWYRTIWAYGLWIVASCAFLAGILYLYTWRLRRQKDLLRRLVAKRTQALLEANDYLESLFDHANAPIIVWDPDLRITRFNRAFEVLTGRTAAQMLGKRLEILFPPGEREAALELIRKELSGERAEVVEITVQHTDGSIRTVLWNSATLLAADGKTPLATISQIQDISGRKIAEEKIKNLLAEKEVFLKEVHHRIKNNMASVNGLFSLQVKNLTNPEAIAALKDASSRVLSMTVLYEKLYQSIDSDQVEIRNYLPSLVDEIIANFPNSARVKVEKNIGDFVLSAKKLQPLGIIINELLTNIMKYAFLGRSDGLITVAAELQGDRVSLAIRDNGVGFPETIDIENSTGFGLRLVGILIKQLGGTIRMERGNGTGVILEFQQ